MSDSLISKLPHRAPFLFIQSVQSISANAVKASWTLDGSESFFKGHFPHDSIVPGVLLIEALAQTAGLLLISRDPDGAHAGMLVHSDIRFRAPVRPPAVISLFTTEQSHLGNIYQFSVEAKNQELLVADGTLVLSVAHPSITELDF